MLVIIRFRRVKYKLLIFYLILFFSGVKMSRIKIVLIDKEILPFMLNLFSIYNMPKYI